MLADINFYPFWANLLKYQTLQPTKIVTLLYILLEQAQHTELQLATATQHAGKMS